MVESLVNDKDNMMTLTRSMPTSYISLSVARRGQLNKVGCTIQYMDSIINTKINLSRLDASKYKVTTKLIMIIIN